MDTQHLKHLKLRNFRSHRSIDLNFDSKFIYFSGANGVGKTNILEAISLFSPGRGLRSANVNDLKSISGSYNWHLSSVFEIRNVLLEIELGVDNKGKKLLRVDGKKKPQIYLGEILKIIWLTPVMDRLWIGSASERRRFFDRLVMNFFPEHAKYCILYDQALKKRNQLLKENEEDIAWFLAIEKQLSEIGVLIDRYRRLVINLLNEMQNSMENKGFFPILNIGLDTNGINSENLLDQFARKRKVEMVAKRTLIGPHKTDLLVRHSIKNINAKHCSTGEQKSLLLSLFILSSLAISKKFGKPPIILLDEIVAHLDKKNLSNFFDQLISINAQIFATGTEKNNMDILKVDFLSYYLDLNDDITSVVLN